MRVSDPMKKKRKCLRHAVFRAAADCSRTLPLWTGQAPRTYIPFAESSAEYFIRVLPCVFSLFLPRSSPAPEVPMPETPLSPVPQFISMNNAGAQASIDDPAFGGTVDVMVEGSFTSASGRDCRRAVVSQPPHEAEIIILCRQGEGWELMPRVWGRGLDR